MPQIYYHCLSVFPSFTAQQLSANAKSLAKN